MIANSSFSIVKAALASQLSRYFLKVAALLLTGFFFRSTIFHHVTHLPPIVTLAIELSTITAIPQSSPWTRAYFPW